MLTIQVKEFLEQQDENGNDNGKIISIVLPFQSELEKLYGLLKGTDDILFVCDDGSEKTSFVFNAEILYSKIKSGELSVCAKQDVGDDESSSSNPSDSSSSQSSNKKKGWI
jgi:hypothetical protein